MVTAVMPSAVSCVVSCLVPCVVTVTAMMCSAAMMSTIIATVVMGSAPCYGGSVSSAMMAGVLVAVGGFGGAAAHRCFEDGR